MIIFTYELVRRLEGKGITVNCMHPGFVRTGIWKNAGILCRLIIFAYPFIRSPEKGAETIIYLASSEEVANITGKYFFDKKKRDHLK